MSKLNLRMFWDELQFKEDVAGDWVSFYSPGAKVTAGVLKLTPPMVMCFGVGGSTEDEVPDALQKLDPVWGELFPAGREPIVKLLLKETTLSADGLDVSVRTNGLRLLTAELVDGAEPKMAEGGVSVTAHVPMTFKVRSGRKEIILPQEANTAPDVGPRWPIVVALARACRWQRMIGTREVTGMIAIAAQHGVGRAYVSHTFALAMLARDLTEATLDGEEPGGLSLAKR